MAAHNEECRREPTVRERNAGPSGRRDRAGHPGHDIERNARLLERLCLLAAPPEDERIAALQPHDTPPALRRPDHDDVNVLLRERVATGTFADEESLRAPRQGDHTFVDQRVVQHEIRAPETQQCLSCEKLRIAWSSADQRDMPQDGHGTLSRLTAEPAEINIDPACSACSAPRLARGISSSSRDAVDS